MDPLLGMVDPVYGCSCAFCLAAALNGSAAAATTATVATTPSDALLSGSRLNGWSAMGSYGVLTYAFPTSDPTAVGQTVNFQPFTEELKSIARQAFAEIAALTNLTPVEVPEGQGALLTLFRSDLNSTGSGSGSLAGLGSIGMHQATKLYTWIDTSWASAIATRRADIADTIYHEIGHNLGLKHPFDSTPVLSTALDTRANTVMSYTFVSTGGTTGYRSIDREALTRLYGTDSDAAGEEVAASWNAAARRLDVTLLTPVDYAGSALDEFILANGTGSGATVNAGDGADTVVGSALSDQLSGNPGNDRIDGGGGADTVVGGPGNDSLSGGDDADQLAGGLGNDTILGGNGADELRGGGGQDSLEGGAGNDTLYGGEGADLLFGGPGEDLFVAGMQDTILGGQGNDTLYSGDAGAVGSYYSDPTLASQYNYVANARMGDGDDLLLALHANAFRWSQVWGGLGSDTIRYGDTSDTLTLGSSITGVEWIDGGGGNDSLDLGFGNSLALIDDADATGFDTSSAIRLTRIETVSGGGGSDTIVGSSHGDAIVAYGDTVVAGGGADTVTISYGWGSRINGGDGDDLVRGGGFSTSGGTTTYYSQYATIDGGNGNDTLYASWGGDTLTGGAGADRFAFETLPITSSLSARILVTDFNAADGDRVLATGATGVSSAVGYTGDVSLSFQMAGGSVSIQFRGLSSFDRSWLIV